MPSVIKSKVSAYTVPRSGGKREIRLEVDLLHEDGKLERRKTKVTGLAFSEANMVAAKEKFLPVWINILEENTEEVREIINKSGQVFRKLGERYVNSLNSDNRGYTNEGYKQDLENYIYPAFGEMYIQDIDLSHLQDWVNDFLRGVDFKTGVVKEPKAMKTLSNVLTPFRGVFSRAVSEKLIPFNPWDNMKDFLKSRYISQANIRAAKKEFDDDGELVNEAEEGRVDPYSKSEIDAIIEAASGWFKDFVIIQFYTAMRPSEIIFLKWSSVNLTKRFIIVKGAITGKETLKERERTKTKASLRKIYLAPQAVEAFMRQEQRTDNELNKSNTVFLNQMKQPYASSHMISGYHMKRLFGIAKWKRTGKLVEVENPLPFRYRPIKQLRHSFASYVLTNNLMPILQLTEHMGHASSEVTFKKYSRFAPNDEKQIFESIDNL
jgi:integrase